MQSLTKRAVEAAKPPTRKEGESESAYRARWSWLGDAEVRGFGVKVYGSGLRTFALRYRTQAGRTRMLTLGAFGELTVDAARNMAREEKVDILKGGDPQAKKQAAALAIPSVRHLMARWLEDYAKEHRRRWEEDKRRSDSRILPALGRLPLEALTPERVASWHRKLGKTAKVEANRCVETLRAAWRWADREGLLPKGAEDPTRRVKRYREKSRDRWLRVEEVGRLIQATEKEEDPYLRAAVPLLLLTGLRKRELLSARWENVDMERGEIRLPETKTGAPQVRLLPAPAVALFRELPRMHGSPFVFPSPVDPTKARTDFKRGWDRIRKAADLEEITLHDLRRTAGSHMAQAGVPLQVIQQVLGHSHPGVTKLYARLASVNERNALDTLADALSSPLGLATVERKGEALPDRLRALLEATEGDPEALAEGLNRLGLGKAAEA